METLKIAHIDLIPKLNGGHVAIANLVRALAKEGHEVQLIRNAPNNIEKKYEKVKGLNGINYSVHYLKRPRTSRELPENLTLAIKKILELEDKYRFDVIHAHTVGGIAVSLCRKEEIKSKFILSLHGNQLYRALTLLSDITRRSTTLLKEKYVSNLVRNLIGALVYTGFETLASKTAYMTTVPSKFDRTIMMNMHIFKEHDIAVMPNCLNDSFFNGSINQKDIIHNEESQVILYSGALSPLKGTHYLLEAMLHVVKELPSAKLIIAGDGFLKESVLKYQKKIGSDKIKHYGWVPHRDMNKFYSAANVLAHPSLYESCSLTIAEAMSFGVPVAAFNTSGIPEYFIQGKTGFLCDIGKTKDLATNIINILENKKLARDMAIKGRQFAEKTFSPGIIAREMESIYKYVT